MDEAVQEYELTAADRFVAPVCELATRSAASPARWRNYAPLLLSLVMHLGLLVGMAGWGLSVGIREQPALLLATPASEVALEELHDRREIKVSVERESLVFSRVSGLTSSVAAGESMPSPLTVVTESSAQRRSGASPLSDVNGLFDGQHLGAALAESGKDQGGADFFGVHAAGRRFVFVVDSSQSMRGRKWATACKELIASIGRLKEQQAFYVIFFDVDTHPMFSQRRPERDLIDVNEKNRKRLKRWLPSIKLGSDTRPLHAMQLALRMNPDAVFLLSDGEFADPTRDFLMLENYDEADDGSRVTRVPIHTVGFHSLAAEAVLKPIAFENSGQYRFVPGRK